MNAKRHSARLSMNDRGSAMVAALAVAIVGMSLASVVLARTIIVTRDAGRDAVRTAEVHGAEAALDATLRALEDGYPCPGPDLGGAGLGQTTIGSGTQTVDLNVEINYADNSGPLSSCVAGEIAGTPTSAVVTATATAAVDQPGIEPTRVFEMNLLLEPRTSEDHGAAIFAASYLFTGAGLTLLPGAGGEYGDVYLGDGDYSCQTKVTVEGNLFVPEGMIDFRSNSCSVSGDLWAESGFEVQAAKGVTVGGNVTVESGNFVSRAKEVQVGGDVTLGGVLVESGPSPGFDIGGSVTQNAVVPDLGAIELPVIEFIAGDWTSEGFIVRNQDYWRDWMIDEAQANGDMDKPWQVTNYSNHPCVLEQSEIGKGPFDLPSDDTVFDLQYCTTYGTPGVIENNQALHFVMWADTAFIIRGWQDRGSLTFTSGDGDPHRLFLIVPYSWGTGQINTHTGSEMNAPIEVFLYTPGEILFHNESYTHGQIYGERVEVHAGADFYYTPSDIPGVSLSVTPTVVGSSVIIVNKREVG